MAGKTSLNHEQTHHTNTLCDVCQTLKPETLTPVICTHACVQIIALRTTTILERWWGVQHTTARRQQAVSQPQKKGAANSTGPHPKDPEQPRLCFFFRTKKNTTGHTPNTSQQVDEARQHTTNGCTALWQHLSLQPLLH